MRFTRKHYEAEYRVKKFFAWLPVELQFETRWLETVYILQSYRIYPNIWLDIKWSDEDHYKLYLAGHPSFNDA